VNNNIVEKSGSWFSYKSDRIGQGRENARAFLKENKDVLAKLDGEVRKALGLVTAAPQPASANAQAAGAAHTGKVATMPTAAESAKIPAARR
jgi:recombination protein RecA